MADRSSQRFCLSFKKTRSSKGISANEEELVGAQKTTKHFRSIVSSYKKRTSKGSGKSIAKNHHDLKVGTP